MSMRWEDERYVRIYTRDTIAWLGLSFIAQGLFHAILRKVDRAGLMKLGKAGKRGVAIMIGFAGEWPRLEPALEELLEDGCVSIQGEYLLVPNFIEAQEAAQSDAQRQREKRARDRDLAASRDAMISDKTSQVVTSGHETGQKVTAGHAVSRPVTPSLAVPNQPSRAEPEEKKEAPPRGGLPTRDERRAEAHPQTAALLASLAEKGCPLGHCSELPMRAAIEATISTAPPGVEDRVLAAWGVIKKPTIGWYQEAITGGPSKLASIKTGSAAPAAHAAFGTGGVRAIE